MEISDVRLMGPTEIGVFLGHANRQRTWNLINRRDFPAPRWKLAKGDIWWADDVEAWAREHQPTLAEDPETD